MMQLEGFSPDTVTFICCMKACSNMRDIDKGREIQTDTAKQGSIATHVTIGKTLVDRHVWGSVANLPESKRCLIS